jgi:hypothetical protein
MPYNGGNDLRFEPARLDIDCRAVGIGKVLGVVRIRTERPVGESRRLLTESYASGVLAEPWVDRFKRGLCRG